MRLNTSNLVTYKTIENTLMLEVDYARFLKQATALIQSDHDEESRHQWALFCKHINALNEKKPEKLMLLQVAFRCFSNPLTHSDLTQFITLAMHLKSVYGTGLYRQIMEATVPEAMARMQDYVSVLQLLVDLSEHSDIAACVKKQLPNLQQLLLELQALHAKALEDKYPKRNIDAVLERFATADDITPFPLPREKLAQFKTDYLTYEERLKEIKILPQETLKALFLKHGKLQNGNKDKSHAPMLLAIMAETIRRIYKILPYDTQILSLIALLYTPDASLKGHVAQIKTGEGKSTIIAMLAAFIGSNGNFVDLVTSSSYLAIRDCKLYAPFYQGLGLSVSHISYKEQEQAHFHAQILYGTNSDYEFALLRDQLNHEKLRYSYPLGETKLKPRTFDFIVVDEVDNMMLDTLGAARMSIPGDEDISWIYEPILDFVTATLNKMPVTLTTAGDLRKYLQIRFEGQRAPELLKMTDAALQRRVRSAQVALYRKEENRDYLIKNSEVVIVDYANTGRTNEGCQWQHGIHQFLQAKHHLKITPESLTGASVSHPTYFGSYKTIVGLTGTMGEPVERDEVQEIYGIDSFDVPPHFPCLRKTLPPHILANSAEQSKVLLQMAKEMQAAHRPFLILFESIKESNDFSEYLRSNGIQNQLLNETQRESEDYIVARAGEAGMVTVATNVAARGTDIILSPESKQAGGLKQVFAFYPENSRVEGQGNGRGGRQGQPGSCCMVLNFEDPRIQSLLKSHPDALSIMQGMASDEQRVKYLNQLRTEKIQAESRERRYTSQLESLYYHCLNEFCLKLQSLHEDMNDKGFDEQIKKACESEPPPATSFLPINENEQPWSVIYRSSIDLMRNYLMGKPVDWTAFIGQFKDGYITFVLKRWGMFYSKLSDQVNGMDISVATLYIQQAYEKLSVPRDFSSASALTSLHYLLYKASLALAERSESQLTRQANLTFFTPTPAKAITPESVLPAFKLP